jgi:hypothetical protein
LENQACSGRSGQLDVLAFQATGLGAGWTLTVVGFFQFAMSFCHDDAIREIFLPAATAAGAKKHFGNEEGYRVADDRETPECGSGCGFRKNRRVLIRNSIAVP